MGKRLTDNITSKYFEAANKLTSQHARRKIVAYVESYDDIFFWRSVLGRFENDKVYFEIMLPSREQHLERGKKAAISQMLGSVGKDMIACVDADYDYLIQGRTSVSKLIIENPYIFHTYVYAIENYHCYAPGLHDTCVMVTLNDHQLFNFEEYLTRYSQIIYPLFVWSIWFYRHPFYHEFTITDFCQVIETGKTGVAKALSNLQSVEAKVEKKLRYLEKNYPEFEIDRKKLQAELLGLGVNPDNTYLYIQGHHLFDNTIAPLVTKICERLVNERQEEINRQSRHRAQRQTEMLCYTHSIESVTSMMKKNTYYQNSEPFRRVLEDIEHYLSQPTDTEQLK